MRTENDESFQNGTTWILGDTNGNAFHYWAGDELLNGARGRWPFVQIPLAGGDWWQRTEVGNPSLTDIDYIEIHADTWEYGYTLWVDGLTIGNLAIDEFSEGSASLWQVYAEDERPTRVEDDTDVTRVGDYSLRFTTEGGFDNTLRYPLGVGPLSVSCLQSPLPGTAGEPVIWSAVPTGGSGEYTVRWRGTDELQGSGLQATRTYGPGMKQAWVTFTSAEETHEFDCDIHFHVVPAKFSEPPTVNPVLWTPAEIDPTPWVEQMERNLREVQAAFHTVFGKTFKMNPLTVIRSDTSEADLCGGDCEELEMTDKLMRLARKEAQEAVGNIIPYTREVLVMAWGAGGWAGAFGWDIPLAGVGDWAIGGAVGDPQHEINDFHGGVYTIGHELGHNISYDDPHGNDYLRPDTVGDFDRLYSEGSPWLYVTLDDITPPEVRVDEVRISQGGVELVVSASDNDAVEAVALIIDGELHSVDTEAPYNRFWNTAEARSGRHELRVKVYDRTGNTAQVVMEIDL